MRDYACVDRIVESDEILMMSEKSLDPVYCLHLAFLCADNLLVSFNMLVVGEELFHVFMVILLLLNKVIPALYSLLSPLMSGRAVFRAH